MDKDFNKNYYKYFLWNTGLLEHFFAKGKQDILLYIDNQLLEEIGLNRGIEADDYREDFITSVENFCANYNYYICPKNDPNKDKVCKHSDCSYYSTSPRSCLKSEERIDVLAVANHICTKGIEYLLKYEDNNGGIRARLSDDKKALKHSLPFFAIVIYIILKFDNGNTQEWKNVGVRNHDYIMALWTRIHHFDNRFDKDASRYDPKNRERNDYCGRIMYHLPLSAPTRNKIQDVIYKSGIWKWVDSKSFVELIGLMVNSLGVSDDLREILLNCYSQNDYKGILARNVQLVIDNFDIEAYESKLEERKQLADFKRIKVSGEFALGIYFPDLNKTDELPSIVLLTTIQQNVNCNGFCIRESKSGTLGGYNTSFVTPPGSGRIELKDYSLENKDYNIVPLRTGEVAFFYKYDDSLYIQTREILPAKSYIIAVRKGTEKVFKEWCGENENSLTKLPTEDVCHLFGEGWTIYYTENLKGQYYSREEKEANGRSAAIVMRGGIRKNINTYLINALPYFELPAGCTKEDIHIYLNLNGKNLKRGDGYKYNVVGNKLILNIDVPIGGSEIAYIDICIEKGEDRLYRSINVCGQNINYVLSSIYKFDKFGIRTENVAAYWGNNIDTTHQSKNVEGVYEINEIKNLESISDDLYFINLLAACCYGSERAEISHDKFRKCISYAATRLGINIQQEGFISKMKKMLSNVGILSIDYSTNKCQAIPPTFLRVPFSLNQVKETQMQMLCGCYTRAFVADLISYCEKKKIGIYLKGNCRLVGKYEEERLLPPIILIDYQFDPKDFSEQYKHQCDIMGDYDFAQSLLKIVPEYKDICAKFTFAHDDSVQFLSRLDSTEAASFPRIRTIKNSTGQKYRYIEKSNNEFAEIGKGLTTWASIYCHHEMKTPMAVFTRDNTVYLPTTLALPCYVERALYLMNLGLPVLEKVFVCGNTTISYYTMANHYGLHSKARCDALASKLTGGASSDSNYLARRAIRTNLKMEFYRSSPDYGKWEIYLVLKQETDILAVAHKHMVYVYVPSKKQFRKLDVDTVNKGMSFLIENNKKWKVGPEGKTIGYSNDKGLTFEHVFSLTEDVIDLPDLSKFDKEYIKII